MSVLWWLALLPLLVMPLTYLLRRRSLLAGGLAAGACLAAAALSLTLPGGETAELLGRLFALDLAGRLILLLVLPLVAVLSLYPWPAPTAGLFRPFALLGVALATVGVLSRSLPLSVLLLELGALGLIVPLQFDAWRPGRRAAGYLIFVVVVMPCLLLTGWLIEGYSPIPENAWALRPMTVLLTVGLGLVLGLIPFYGWWKALVEQAPPAVMALVGAAFPGVALGLLVSGLERFPWMVEEGVARPALLGLGLLSAVAGAMLGLLPDHSASPSPQTRLRRVLVWWTVHDLGVIAVGVGTGSLTGLTGAALGLLSRGLALTLLAMGLNASEGSKSLTWRWRALIILVGGWTLAGAPLSAAFPGRWLVYRAVFDLEPAVAYLLILSAVLVVLSFLRGLRAALTAGSIEGTVHPGSANLPRPGLETAPSPLQILVIVALVILIICLGLFPQLVIEHLVSQMAALAFLQ